MMGMALRVVRSDGVLALYNGLSASLCRQVPQGPPPPRVHPPSGAPVGPDPRAYSWCPPGHPSYPLGAHQDHRSNFLLLFKAAWEEGSPRHGAGDPGWAQGMAVCGMLPSTFTGSVSPALTAGLRRHLQMGKLRPGEGKGRERRGCWALDSASPRCANWLSHLLATWPWEGFLMSLWFPSDDRVPGCVGWGEPQGAGRAQHRPSTCTL